VKNSGTRKTPFQISRNGQKLSGNSPLLGLLRNDEKCPTRAGRENCKLGSDLTNLHNLDTRGTKGVGEERCGSVEGIKNLSKHFRLWCNGNHQELRTRSLFWLEG